MAVAADIVAVKSVARVVAQQRRTPAWADWTTRGKDAAAQALARHSRDVVALAASLGVRPFAASGAGVVASAFWPMRTEIDPLTLLSSLAGAGFVTALPVVASRGQPLVFRRWSSGDPTVAAGFGTREPPPENAVVEPDLLLVPLLAFDANGYRLGYGGGFYDRTLRRLRNRGPVCAVGVAFDEQMIDAVPHLDYDERLDAVSTPAGLLRF